MTNGAHSFITTAAGVDAFEDSAVEHLWVWELRDVRALPKHLQPLGKDAKKHWQQAQSRLAAVGGVVQCLQGGDISAKAQQKLTKAVEKLHKVAVVAAPAPGAPAPALVDANTPDPRSAQRAKRKYACGGFVVCCGGRWCFVVLLQMYHV